LESIKDADANVIKKVPLPVQANFQQRALDVTILDVNAKTDFNSTRLRFFHSSIK
jgi:hypothetical protein